MFITPFDGKIQFFVRAIRYWLKVPTGRFPTLFNIACHSVLDKGPKPFCQCVWYQFAPAKESDASGHSIFKCSPAFFTQVSIRLLSFSICPWAQVYWNSSLLYSPITRSVGLYHHSIALCRALRVSPLEPKEVQLVSTPSTLFYTERFIQWSLARYSLLLCAEPPPNSHDFRCTMKFMHHYNLVGNHLISLDPSV